MARITIKDTIYYYCYWAQSDIYFDIIAQNLVHKAYNYRMLMGETTEVMAKKN